MTNFTKSWVQTLTDVLSLGKSASPRGLMTLELPQYTSVVNMRQPVLLAAERKLSYKFMLAEAFWILSGDNRVETIAPYNNNISQFSDDGVTYFGAYGPHIHHQMTYVVNKLAQDPDTRQAGLTIWIQNPPETKDVPCTIAIFFNIREVDGGPKLNCHVFMRSSDIWLGLPYDVFNFSMLAHLICCKANRNRPNPLMPGTLYVTGASTHLYKPNWEKATDIHRKCSSPEHKFIDQLDTPRGLFMDEAMLMNALQEGRDDMEKRWWQ